MDTTETLQTWAALKAALRDQIWPQGEQSNLVVAHNRIFVEAAVNIATYVDCWQINNVEIIPPCGILFQSGMSVVQAPKGNIFRVSTYDQLTSTGLESATANVNWDAEVRYTKVNHQRMRKLVDSTLASGCLPIAAPFAPGYPVPTNAGYDGYPELPLGFKYPQPSLDRTCNAAGNLWGTCTQRALAGIWGLESGRIYLAPWMQTTEWLAIEWDGIKRAYADTDLVSADPDWMDTIKKYVFWVENRDYLQDMGMAAQYKQEYREALATLNFTCREQNRDHFPTDRRSIRSLLTLQEQSNATTAGHAATPTSSPGTGPALITAIPDAPTAHSSAPDANDITVTWDDPSNGRSNFIIQKLVDDVWVDIGTAPPGTTTFTDTGLDPGTTGCYRIISVNSAGQSVPSNQTCVTTPTASTLINIDFTDTVPSVKVGVAATGVGSSDFWNGWKPSFGTGLVALKFSDNNSSPFSIYVDQASSYTVIDNGYTDPMLQKVIKNVNLVQPASKAVHITDLTVGTYDIYIYGGYGRASSISEFDRPVWEVCVNGIPIDNGQGVGQTLMFNGLPQNAPPYARSIYSFRTGTAPIATNYWLKKSIAITTAGSHIDIRGGDNFHTIGISIDGTSFFSGLQLVKTS